MDEDTEFVTIKLSRESLRKLFNVVLSEVNLSASELAQQTQPNDIDGLLRNSRQTEEYLHELMESMEIEYEILTALFYAWNNTTQALEAEKEEPHQK